jgi:predicted porin
MKKSLIALAALSTIAGSVAAQSSVSVYGRLDVGFQDTSTTDAALGVKTDTSAIGYNAFTNSRLGVMGTEDLGGGLKAGFVVEGNIAAAPGTTGSNNAAAFNFGRQQYMTLSSNNTGTLLVGKTDALVKTVFDSYDAGYANNLVGAYDGMGTSATEIATANIIGSRRDLVARYTSPKFSNFDVSFGMMKNETSTDGDKVQTDDGYELGARYAVGALSLAAAYRSADTTTAGGAADTTANSTALGASYNFGRVVAFAQYFEQEDKNNLDASKVKEDAYAIGVRVPMGKSTLFASYTDGDQTSAAGVNTKFDGYQAGVKYDLSKRTYGYVAYGKADKQQDGADQAKAENLAIGIAHHF